MYVFFAYFNESRGISNVAMLYIFLDLHFSDHCHLKNLQIDDKKEIILDLNHVKHFIITLNIHLTRTQCDAIENLFSMP